MGLLELLNYLLAQRIPHKLFIQPFLLLLRIHIIKVIQLVQIVHIINLLKSVVDFQFYVVKFHQIKILTIIK